jgi:hypothetical protein
MTGNLRRAVVIGIIAAAVGAGFGSLFSGGDGWFIRRETRYVTFCAGTAALLSWLVSWSLIAWRPARHAFLRLLQGLAAGVIAGLLSHPVFWALLWFLNPSSRGYQGNRTFTSLLGHLEDSVVAVSLFSLAFSGWATALLGALVGALAALFSKPDASGGRSLGRVMASGSNRLPVVKIVLAATLFAYEWRAVLARALVLPFVALTLTWFWFHAVTAQTGATAFQPRGGIILAVLRGVLNSMAVAVVYGILFTPFAIRCHRITLLGPGSIASSTRWLWTARETRFAVSLVVFFAAQYLSMFASLALTFPISIAGAMLQAHPLVSYAGQLLAVTLAAYPVSRLSIIFPSIAIDKPLTIASAWQISRGNGWRLLAITVPFFYAQRAIRITSPDANPILVLTSIALSNLVLIVGIVAFSLAYSELMKNVGKG